MLRRKTIEADLCVVGGGMSGICAAIAAARGEAKLFLCMNALFWVEVLHQK